MEYKIDRLLIFDIKGAVAHFRKFYTNSSSLSYSFPPRTTITGLIAGILGRERDQYYEEFSTEKCKIAISIRTPVRKIMQTVNYIQTKSDKGGIKGVNLSAGHTQIPLEIILPDRGFEELKYRIYFYHKEQVFEQLKKVLKEKKFVYPPYLGLSEFIGELEFIDCLEETDIMVYASKKDTTTDLVTVVNTEKIQEGGLIFEEDSGKILQYIKEQMPLEFDSQRNFKKGANFLYEKNNSNIKLKIKENYYKINYNNSEKKEIEENIVFMES
ncbi:MAG TPA: type I-B CRISPR-associated protein Cas5b [bacterium]|nr:type I-B CRISPR-associated protein Cas5b [bacterium]